jgi:hypothetical protein
MESISTSSTNNSKYRWDIFISHSSRLAPDDNELIRAMAHALNERHLRVFLDQLCLKKGQPLISTLEKEICASRAGLIVLTASTRDSSWVDFEIEFMMQRYRAGLIHLLVLCLDSVSILSRFPGAVAIISPKNRMDLSTIIDEVEHIVKKLPGTTTKK